MQRAHRIGHRLLGLLLLTVAFAFGPLAVSAADSSNPLGLTVHHITARVADIERATTWYHDVLGFQVRDRGSRQHGAMKYADLQLPGFGIGLIQLDQPGAAASTGQAPVPSWVHIVFAVADPNALYQKFKKNGVHVMVRGGEPAGPVSTFLLYDSEGNEIEIVAADQK